MASVELASLAMNSFLALAVLGSDAAAELAPVFERASGGFLLRRAIHVLEQTRTNWYEQRAGNISVLDRCLDILRGTR